MKNYGHIQVSSTDLNEERQLIITAELRIKSEYIYKDKQSGDEREKICTRQAEDTTAARARSVKRGRGRHKIMPPENFGSLVKKWECGELTRTELLAITGFKRSTFENRLSRVRQ